MQGIARRIERGFEELAAQPRYLDLPAYDSLRDLAPGGSSSGTIPLTERVLVLCPYEEYYQQTREFVRLGIEEALQLRDVVEPKVLRLIDLESPQLVSRLLYQNIRRVSACVMDWSGFSPSAFLELGVRLAVSPWGAVQIIQNRYLGGGEAPLTNLQQIPLMRDQLTPIPYELNGSEEPFEAVASALITRNPFDDPESSYSRIHRIVSNALDPVTLAYTATVEELRVTADSLHDSEQERSASPQLLFRSSNVKRDREQAALERRLTAWLYLEYRLKVREREVNDPLRLLHRQLGRDVAAALYDSGREEDLAAMAGEIKHTGQVLITVEEAFAALARNEQREAALHRKRGDAFRKLGKDSEASESYRQGLASLDNALTILCGKAPNPLAAAANYLGSAAELVETLGSRGGILRRLSDTNGALESYQQGAAIEMRFVPSSTYNRTNAVKLALLAGRSSLAALHDEITALEQALALQLQDAKAADAGWRWADLGDCRALLGDVDGAATRLSASSRKPKAALRKPRLTCCAV